MPFELTEEQAAVVENRGGGLLVSAAAGSGKTRVLVERLLKRVSEEGVDLDRFLVITYTKAAAAELRSRIAEELSQRLAKNPTDHHLRRQQTLLYKAQISTIHAFCAQLLRENGHLLDLDPDFRLCDEGEANLLMLRALDDVLERRYEKIEEGSDFSLLVDTMSAGRDDQKLVQIVLDIRARIQSHPDPAAWLEEQGRAFELVGVSDAAQTPWGALLLAEAGRQGDYWLGRLDEALKLCGLDPNLDLNYSGSLCATMDAIQHFLDEVSLGWDAAVSALPIAFPRAGSRKIAECPEAAERVKFIRSSCKKRLDKLWEQLSDTSEGLLSDMRAVYPAVRGLFALVNDFEGAYAGEKRRRGLLDFADLEHMAVSILSPAKGEPSTALACMVAARFDEIMVDEYQDTNAVQNAIFTCISREGKNLFLVGDVKQSIYRFRLADPTIFLDKYRTFKPYTQAVEGEERRIVLSKNFRSRSPVLEGVNFIFRNIMSNEFGEMDYGEEEALYPGAHYPTGPYYAVELDALNLAGTKDGEAEKIPRDLQEARFVADRISGLLEEKFPLSDGQEGSRPTQYADIVILLRSPGSALHHYVRALGERNIPWESEGGGDFFAATEVSVALSLLQVVDNPRQDVALLSVLRSPVYAFTADRLAQLRAAAPQGDFYSAVVRGAEAGGTDCAAFLQELADLRFGAGDKDSYELLWHIYDQTNLLGVFGSMGEAERRQGNLFALCELARSFENAGYKGLFSFLSHLTRLRERGGKLLIPQVGREGGGVRIMSIHRSKGLEFPVVFLTGLMRRLNRDDMKRPILFHPKLGVGPKRLDLERMVEYPTLARYAVARQLEKEMMAEELRLLYVAMTRAREKLIMTCAMTGGAEQLAKLAENAACPVDPQVLMSCSSVGEWVLLPALAQPDRMDFRLIDGVVYEKPETQRQDSHVVKAEQIGDLDALMTQFAWHYPYRGDVEIPSKLTATQRKGMLVDEEVAQDFFALAEAEIRETGDGKKRRICRPRFAEEEFGLTPAQRGTALHLVMQHIDFTKTGSVEEIREEIARLTAKQFLTPQQGEAVEAKKIHTFFSSFLGRELLHAATLRREFKFSVLVDAQPYYKEAGAGERVLLQGVVDCFFETPAGLTVLDFKTDRVTTKTMKVRAEAYHPQMMAYSKALEEITSRRVARCVLWFFAADGSVEL